MLKSSPSTGAPAFDPSEPTQRAHECMLTPACRSCTTELTVCSHGPRPPESRVHGHSRGGRVTARTTGSRNSAPRAAGGLGALHTSSERAACGRARGPLLRRRGEGACSALWHRLTANVPAVAARPSTESGWDAAGCSHKKAGSSPTKADSGRKDEEPPRRQRMDEQHRVPHAADA
jgi:hypothetical protein